MSESGVARVEVGDLLVATPGLLDPNFIIPTVFNAQVPKAVAAAIRGAAVSSA